MKVQLNLRHSNAKTPRLHFVEDCVLTHAIFQASPPLQDLHLLLALSHLFLPQNPDLLATTSFSP